MLVQTKIQKWGNSLAVRIPKEIARKLAFKVGSPVTVRESGKELIFSPADQQVKTHGVRDIRKYIIPSGKKEKEDVVGQIDKILYGKPD